MKTICATKRLQNTKLFKEYISLRDGYYKLSLEKEHNQQSFFKNKQFVKKSSGEFITPSYSFENHYKKYNKSIEQKVYCIERIAKDKNLVPIFITITLDSRFHPFKSISRNEKRLYTSLNKSFIFKDEGIDTAIKTGYSHLNNIFRIFYKRCQSSVNSLMYVKIFEIHKNLIPHQHILFFVLKSDIKIIRKKLNKIKEEFNLDQVDFELVNDELQKRENSSFKTGVKRASKYLMKYITKSMKEDPFCCRLYDGWKRKNRVRMITSSNLDLSLSDYRTIYHNLDENNKNSLLEKAKKEDVNIFYYILKNLYKAKFIKKDNKTILKQYGNIDKAELKLFTTVTRTATGSYKTNNLTFFINDFIYEKETYTIIRSDYYEQ